MIEVLRKFKKGKVEVFLRRFTSPNSTSTAMVYAYEVEEMGSLNPFTKKIDSVAQAKIVYAAVVGDVQGKDRSIHEDVVCVELHSTAHYRYKNWSKVFRCNYCGREGRFALNFLGARKVVCDGIAFHKVSRKEVAQ